MPLRRLLVDNYHQMAGALEDRRRVHKRALKRTLPGRPGIGHRPLHVKPIFIDILLIARVGNRREQGLADYSGASFRRELENRKRLVNFLARNQLAYEPELLR